MHIRVSGRRNRFIGLAIAFILSNVSIAAEPDPSSVELNGRWNIKKLVIDGTQLPLQQSRETFFFRIDGALWRYFFIVSGKPVMAEFRVSLDNDAFPIAVDATQLNGRMEGKVCRGILQREGETITFCLAENSSVPRPDKFASTVGSSRYLVVMHRVNGSPGEGD